MLTTVADAKEQLVELVRRAQAGDEVILTVDGRAVVRLVPVNAVHDRTDRRALLETARAGTVKAKAGPSAARSQDFLYSDDSVLE
jgi:prevent-host-death family protein